MSFYPQGVHIIGVWALGPLLAILIFHGPQMTPVSDGFRLSPMVRRVNFVGFRLCGVSGRARGDTATSLASIHLATQNVRSTLHFLSATTFPSHVRVQVTKQMSTCQTEPETGNRTSLRFARPPRPGQRPESKNHRVSLVFLRIVG